MSKAADDKILQYMRDQNRPYSATDVLLNLHKEIGKTQVVKSLETLAKAGHLAEKVYGKQKIYFVNQNTLPSLGETEMKDLETDIKAKTKDVTSLREETRSIDNQLGSLTNSLTTEQGREKLAELNKQLERGKEKLASLKTMCKDIAPEDKIKINKEHQKVVKEWRKRKRMCMDVVNAILENEGCTKSKKELIEEMGIDTDEDMGVSFPTDGA